MVGTFSSCEKEDNLVEGDDNINGETTGGENTTSCNGTTFTDPRDGEQYEIVQIGNQCWFAENLRYTGGNLIEITSQSDWLEIRDSSEIHSWSYYDNQPGNSQLYGVLYSQHAVVGEVLCPSGWHIPTKNDWKELTDYSGGVDYQDEDNPEQLTITPIVGGKLKSTLFWDAPNTGATNESGFSGLAGGGRTNNGNFINLGKYGTFWSSSLNGEIWSQSGKETLYNYYLSYDNADVLRWDHPYAQWSAFSCRCVKD